MKREKIFLFAVVALILFSSCKKDATVLTFRVLEEDTHIPIKDVTIEVAKLTGFFSSKTFYGRTDSLGYCYIDLDQYISRTDFYTIYVNWYNYPLFYIYGQTAIEVSGKDVKVNNNTFTFYMYKSEYNPHH